MPVVRRWTAAVLPLWLLALITVAVPLQAQEKPSIEEQGRKLQPHVEKLRKLKFSHPVKVDVQDRDTLRQRLMEDFKKEMPREKTERFQKALVKYGFMKPGVDLWQTVLDLLSEQIAGFYDPESKELYLIAEHVQGVEAGEKDEDEMSAMMAQMMGGMDQDRLTIVHELTHALQDQNFDLLTLPMGLEDNDDIVTAVKSLVEGEASFTMFDDITSKMGIGLESLPGVDKMLEQGGGMPSGGPGAEMMEKAPNYLKRGLIFPYMGGLGFVQAVKKAGGWDAVNKIYQDLPASTEQVLHPEKYLGERDQPTTVTMPDLAPALGDGWQHQVTNVWGELNLDIMFKEFFPNSKTSSVVAGWDGDQYMVFEHQSSKALLGVMFLVWDSEKDAEQFTTAYKKLLGKKIGVTVPAEKQARYTWDQEDGQIVMERRGAEVLVIEGAPKASLAKLEEAIWAQTGRKELAKVDRVSPPADTAVAGAGEDKPEAPANAERSGTVAGDGWKITLALEHDCCTWNAANGVGETCCTDCSSVFRVTGFPAEAGDTLSDALTAARKRLGPAMAGLKIITQSPLKVDGRVAVRVLLSGTPSEVGEEVTMDLVIVQGASHFFVFVDAAASADYDTCKEMFHAWVKSARIRE